MADWNAHFKAFDDVKPVLWLAKKPTNAETRSVGT